LTHKLCTAYSNDDLAKQRTYSDTTISLLEIFLDEEDGLKDIISAKMNSLAFDIAHIMKRNKLLEYRKH
jgi:hypothetical protein